MTVRLSVCITTYNQEPYVAKAIESVLAQETNFDFEIVLGDDHSTDGTATVLAELRDRHPGTIRLILRESNVGSTANFVDTFKRCRGEYVALIDGDDWWTDPRKLQKQVDFLDRHHDFAICGHRVEFVYEDRRSHERWYPSLGQYSPPQKEVGTLQDAIEIGAYLPTRSRVFRRALLEFPPWFLEVKLGDWALLVLLAQHGRIYEMNEVMAVQRIHASAMWSGMPETERKLQLIRSLQHYRRHLGRRHRRAVMAKMAGAYHSLARSYMRDRDKWAAARLLIKSWAIQLSLFRLPRGGLRPFVRLLWPRAK